MVKAQFMQMWDGLETSIDATVVVMGATNRPKDVDKAILRRMPATFHIGLPDIHQRKRYDLLIEVYILRTHSNFRAYFGARFFSSNHKVHF
jgi:ATP-dependent Zn protease